MPNLRFFRLSRFLSPSFHAYVAAGTIALSACGPSGSDGKTDTTGEASSDESTATDDSDTTSTTSDTSDDSSSSSNSNSNSDSHASSSSSHSGDSSGSGDSSSSSSSSSSGDPELFYLKIEPANTVLELDLNTPATQPFKVVGHYSDGSDIDVTDKVKLSVDNPSVGTVSGASLNIPGFASRFIGSAKITAEVDSVAIRAQVTVAAYRRTGPQLDFFFVLPFEDTTGEQARPLTFASAVKSMDVFINVDTTGSMEDPIENLKSSLSNSVIPAIQSAVPDTQFGVGAFEDFPIRPFGEQCGSSYDQPFTLMQPISPSASEAQAGVGKLTPLGCGRDLPESHIEALYQIATGEGLTGPAQTSVPANHDGIGGVGFREGALPVISTLR